MISVSQLKPEFEALQIQVKLILLSQRVAQLAYNVPGIVQESIAAGWKNAYQKHHLKTRPPVHMCE